jgi:hypothetical protein
MPDVVVQVATNNVSFEDVISIYEKPSGRKIVRKSKSMVELTKFAEDALAG